jgi:AraC-like DNA-binding protein
MEELDQLVHDLEGRLFLGPLSDLIARLRTDPRLARAWLLVKTEYADPSLTLEKAARAAGASKNHLNVLMRNSTSLTFHQLLLRYRVFVAAALMKTTEHCNSLDTALRTGFGTLRAFEQSFRRLLGCSPQSWKCRCPKSRLDAAPMGDFPYKEDRTVSEIRRPAHSTPFREK